MRSSRCCQSQGAWECSEVSRTFLSASRASAACVGQLQEALNERHSIINALKAKSVGLGAGVGAGRSGGLWNILETGPRQKSDTHKNSSPQCTK